MSIRVQCECKQDVLMLRTVAGHWWPFDATFRDAYLIPTKQSFCLIRREGQVVVRAMDAGDRTPDGKVLTRHNCDAWKQRHQDVEGAASVLRPVALRT